MSLVPRVYRSTDAGAPTISGTAGDMVALLDAILVNGYGSGSDAKPAAGWTITYTSSNKRVYRNNPITGTGSYLRVDDTGAVNNARTAAIKGFASMSDIDTGAGQIPPPADAANGSLWLKSGLLTSAANAWLAIATEKWFYLFVNVSSSGLTNEQFRNVPFFAGDLDSRLPGDTTNFAVSWSPTITYTTNATFNSGTFAIGAGYAAEVISQRSLVVLQGSDGTPSKWCCNGVPSLSRFTVASNITLGGYSAAPPYPDPVGGGLMIERVHVVDGAWRIRGFLPNVYAPLHYRPFVNDTPVTDLEGFPGVSFLALTLPCGASATNWGVGIFDITTEAQS
ncbi:MULTISPECIES: hypothetical protein [unclassified Pseudoxanthomonas]|uniref:hypothetical protein n=1 Tax=unclassified Pseudoxanthomonas TaxID=2645906 RepID=UPI00307EFDC4